MNRMKGEDRRAQLLNAAKKVFARKGYHSTNISDIVKEAGVARGTFYLYFSGKRAVFEALLDEFFPMLVAQVKVVDPTQPIEAIWAQIKENARGILKVFLDNPELTQLVLNEAVGLDKGFDQKLMDFYHKLIVYIKESLEIGMDMGLVRRDINPWIVSAAILGSVKETVYDFLHLDFEGVTFDALVENLVNFNLVGVFNKDYIIFEKREDPD